MTEIKKYPVHMFLDTGVFVRGQFNFDSSLLNCTELIKVVENPRIVVPVVTNHEIQRHLVQVSNEKANALVKSLRPKVIKNVLKCLGMSEFDEVVLAGKIEHEFRNELYKYLSQFKAIRPTYEDINIQHVLEWRENLSPPFSEKKSNEYADAMALSSLLNYVNRTGTRVAVISTDKDWKAICELHNELDHFDSIAALVELHLGNQELSEKIKSLLLADDKLGQLIETELLKAQFTIIRGFDGLVNKVDIQKITDKKLSVVEVDKNSSTIVFDYVFEISSDSTYMDTHPANHDSSGVPIPYPVGMHQMSYVNVSGVCIVDTSDIGNNILSVIKLELDQSSFALY